jgi:hydroxymethylglutaryl-CoA synthase
LNSEPIDQLANKRLLLFSYGSGLAASMFSAKISGDTSPQSPLSKLLKGIIDIPQRLAKRIKVSAKEFENTLNLREKIHNAAPYTPTGDIEKLSPGTYFLVDVSDKYHRFYKRILEDNKIINLKENH